MNEFLEFFKNNTGGYLATVDGDKPKVRPWQVLLVEDDKLWFVTTENKRTYQQLKLNPNVEFCSCSQDYVCGRINGAVVFSNDEVIKKKIADNNPNLMSYFKDHNSPKLAMFYLEHGTASLHSTRLNLNEYQEY